MFTRCIFIYNILFPPDNWGLSLTVNVFLQKTPVPNKVDLAQSCLLRIVSALITTESINLRHESLIFFYFTSLSQIFIQGAMFINDNMYSAQRQRVKEDAHMYI